MKIVKTFRIDKDFAEQVNSLAQLQGITFSQFVELACYAMLDEKPAQSKLVDRSKKLETIDLKFCVDQPTYKQLAKIVQSKNSTLSQEVYYRVSASLTYPIFDTAELTELERLHADLNRLGNLFKLAINNKMPVDIALLNEIRNDIKALSDEMYLIIDHSYKRML